MLGIADAGCGGRSSGVAGRRRWTGGESFAATSESSRSRRAIFAPIADAADAPTGGARHGDAGRGVVCGESVLGERLWLAA